MASISSALILKSGMDVSGFIEVGSPSHLRRVRTSRRSVTPSRLGPNGLPTPLIVWQDTQSYFLTRISPAATGSLISTDLSKSPRNWGGEINNHIRSKITNAAKTNFRVFFIYTIAIEDFRQRPIKHSCHLRSYSLDTRPA